MKRSFSLLAAIMVGIFFPSLGDYDFLIRPFLMIMLFFAFWNMRFSAQSFDRSILYLLVANVFAGFAGFLVCNSFSRDYALIAFITGITPTATASPVMLSFLKKKGEYAACSVLVTNMAAALIIPFFLHMEFGEAMVIDLWQLLYEAVSLIVFPLIAVGMLKNILMRTVVSLNETNGGVSLVERICYALKSLINVISKKINFFFWLAVVVFAVARSSDFIRENAVPAKTIFFIALIPFVLAIFNFITGFILGGRKWRIEAAQSLGQKNTMFTVWICLHYLSPLIALGPMFYLIYHNIYNSWLLSRSTSPLQGRIKK